MKIVYLTDIHDALRELRIVLKNTTADLYLLSGDILYKAFYQEDKIYQFVCLQEDFWSLAREMGIPETTPHDMASDILRFPDKYKSGDLIMKAADYRLLYNKAAKTMKEKYQLIEELIRKYSHAECRVLPGNYDLDLRYTALSARDLHHNSVVFRGLTFAGYGGAPIATPGIPQKLAVAYHEKQKNGRLFSEPEDFFSDVEPDVLVLHNPAYGYFDRIPGMGNAGSLGIRNYLDSHSPSLVISGHVHEDYGVAAKNGTVFLNPSNFGGVDSITGWQSGGTFAEIIMEKRNVLQVNLMRLHNESVRTVMEVRRTPEGWDSSLHQDAAAGCPLDLTLFVRDPSGAVAR
ncbi:MAG: metallophosphoesterase [Spirochaetia bacterium]|nr:metallophosphoesterase [Spirochaetia bacterium]